MTIEGIALTIERVEMQYGLSLKVGLKSGLSKHARGDWYVRGDNVGRGGVVVQK